MEQIQNINIVVPRIRKHFQKYPAASVSAMYRSLRSKAYLSLFGDYLILATIVAETPEIGVFPNRNQIKRAMRCSAELSGQRPLLKTLLDLQMEIRKCREISQKGQTSSERYLTSS